MTDFPSQLHAARSHRGLTQEEAAALLGMSRRTYIDLEKGHAKAKPFEMAGMLAMLLAKPVKVKGTP